MEREKEYKLRDRLVKHIKGGEAFSPVGDLLQKISFKQLGITPEKLPYSFYQQFYHIRFAQFDILEYCTNDDYHIPNWPDDYWPDTQAPANEKEWQELKSAYFDERDSLCNLVRDTSNDLLEPFPQNSNHNLLRQVQIVIEHTSYHTGQLYVIYRLLNS